MKSTIFEYENYQEFMKDWFNLPGRRGQLSQAAKAINSQSSFLSRVISEQLNLTPDQAYQLCLFWKLSPDETEYFQLLVDVARSVDRGLKEHLLTKIKNIKQKSAEIGINPLKKKVTEEDLNQEYFSSWIYSAVHFLTCLPNMQQVATLSERLNIPTQQVSQILESLVQRGLVKRNGHDWNFASNSFHLKKTSPFVYMHHQNWRYRALQDVLKNEMTHLHYTSIMTLSRKDLDQCTEILKKAIEDLNKIATPSEPEEAVVLNCDFFKI